MSAVTVGSQIAQIGLHRQQSDTQALHYINIKIFTRRILNTWMLILIVKIFAFIYLNSLKNKKIK